MRRMLLVACQVDGGGLCLTRTEDGGDISLVGIEKDRLVKVQLHGACVSCTVNQMTLKTGVEMTIKKHAPQIEKVISVES